MSILKINEVFENVVLSDRQLVVTGQCLIIKKTAGVESKISLPAGETLIFHGYSHPVHLKITAFGDVTITEGLDNWSHQEPFELPSAIRKVNTEYLSPEQHGGLYGTVYRQYFTTALPSSLTTGDNVTRLIDWRMEADDATDRQIFRGNSTLESTGTKHSKIALDGTSGAGNLTVTLDFPSYTLISGWVDYTK